MTCRALTLPVLAEPTVRTFRAWGSLEGEPASGQGAQRSARVHLSRDCKTWPWWMRIFTFNLVNQFVYVWHQFVYDSGICTRRVLLNGEPASHSDAGSPRLKMPNREGTIPALDTDTDTDTGIGLLWSRIVPTGLADFLLAINSPTCTVAERRSANPGGGTSWSLASPLGCVAAAADLTVTHCKGANFSASNDRLSEPPSGARANGS